MLITLDDYKKAKHKDLIPICCDFCNTKFYRVKNTVRSNFIKNNKTFSCSRKCQNALRYKNKRIDVNCTSCNKIISKTLSEIKKVNNTFCSQSCAATYNNKTLVKKQGTRRSKFEIYIEEQLTILYPDLEIHYNRKDAIGSELDIYIPSLNLAIELNGIFHYEPIFGIDKLVKIQNNDNNKFQKCYENKIDFCIVDISKLKYFKSNNIKPYLDIILNIVNSRMVNSVGFEPTTYGLENRYSIP